MGALPFVYRWVVGTWAGALLGFGVLFAPALFRAFTPSQAGEVVRQVIPGLDALGLAAVAVAVAVALRLEGLTTRQARVRLALLVLAAALAGLSAGWVSPTLASLREEAGGAISALARDNPLRQQFGQLHGVSAGLMLLEWLLASTVLALAPGRRERQG